MAVSVIGLVLVQDSRMVSVKESHCRNKSFGASQEFPLEQRLWQLQQQYELAGVSAHAIRATTLLKAVE